MNKHLNMSGILCGSLKKLLNKIRTFLFTDNTVRSNVASSEKLTWQLSAKDDRIESENFNINNKTNF